MAGRLTVTHSDTASERQRIRHARQLTLLGLLLQALHVLFGVTALLGMLITHSRMHIAKNTVYQSQLRWQQVTFWVALVGYTAGAYLWFHYGYRWVVFAVFAWVTYRLTLGFIYWRRSMNLDSPISRKHFR